MSETRVAARVQKILKDQDSLIRAANLLARFEEMEYQDNLATGFPFWCIVDPGQVINLVNHDREGEFKKRKATPCIHSAVMGLYFSQAAATEGLKANAHNLTAWAHTYCFSAERSSDWRKFLQLANVQPGLHFDARKREGEVS